MYCNKSVFGGQILFSMCTLFSYSLSYSNLQLLLRILSLASFYGLILTSLLQMQ